MHGVVGLEVVFRCVADGGVADVVGEDGKVVMAEAGSGVEIVEADEGGRVIGRAVFEITGGRAGRVGGGGGGIVHDFGARRGEKSVWRRGEEYALTIACGDSFRSFSSSSYHCILSRLSALSHKTFDEGLA